MTGPPRDPPKFIPDRALFAAARTAVARSRVLCTRAQAAITRAKAIVVERAPRRPPEPPGAGRIESPRGEPTTPYATTAAPKVGPYLIRDVRGPIEVHEADSSLPLQVGRAFHVGTDEQDRALWFVTVRKATLPGWYVVIDRRFIRAIERGQPPPWWPICNG
jgi:hypothetical protein